jgi:hypothetical protein
MEMEEAANASQTPTLTKPDRQRRSDMIERKLPPRWMTLFVRVFFGIFGKDLDLDEVVTRLNLLSGQCDTYARDITASHTYIEQLHERCLGCKSLTSGLQNTEPLNIPVYDPNTGLPNEIGLIDEFVHRIRAFLKGSYKDGVMKYHASRAVGPVERRLYHQYTVVGFQIRSKTSIPVMLDTIIAFATILKRRIFGAMEPIGYLGEDRFAVIDFDISRAEADAFVQAIRFDMTRSSQMTDIMLLVGISDGQISFSLETRMGNDFEDKRWRRELGTSIHAALKEIGEPKS